MPNLALLGAGAQLAGGLLNAQAQNAQNRESLMYSNFDYERRKKDSIEFWNMQNEYNSPQAQMKRLQAAGLNPNLVYGSPGGSSGVAGDISTPTPQSPQFRSSEPGNAVANAGLGFMNAMYDLRIKAAQANNLEKQNGVIDVERLLKEAQILATKTGTERSQFGLNLDKLYGADFKREQVRQLATSTDLSLNEDARRAALNASSIREAAERVLSMQAQRANTRAEHGRIMADIARIDKDNILKDMDINLRKNGIMPGDPWWSRIVGTFLGKYFDLSTSNPLNALEKLPSEMKMFPGYKQ